MSIKMPSILLADLNIKRIWKDCWTGCFGCGTRDMRPIHHIRPGNGSAVINGCAVVGVTQGLFPRRRDGNAQVEAFSEQFALCPVRITVAGVLVPDFRNGAIRVLDHCTSRAGCLTAHLEGIFVIAGSPPASCLSLRRT